MIISFKSRPLKKYWTKGKPEKLPPQDLARIDLILTYLDKAEEPEDMDIAGFNFHPLKGDKKGRYTCKVNFNWRITFAFDEDNDAIDVDFEDYHND